MTATDLEDLLKEKIVTVPDGVVLNLFLMDQSQILRNENPGHAILGIYANNPEWNWNEVPVLPNPLSHRTTTEIVITEDDRLKSNEFRIVYYDAFEVDRF